MAQSVTITFKDGREKRRFDHRPRGGGSYTLQTRYETAFFVVIDEWGSETAFPVSDIQEVNIESEQRGF